MWGITVQNEPFDGLLPGFVFNCMAFKPEEERDFIANDLGPALKKAGYGVDKLKLMIMDDQRSFINQWADIVLKDNASSQYVSGIAFHWYANSISPPEVLDKVLEKYPDYFLLNTEACEGSNPFNNEKVSLGNWDRAESYSYDIIKVAPTYALTIFQRVFYLGFATLDVRLDRLEPGFRRDRRSQLGSELR